MPTGRSRIDVKYVQGQRNVNTVPTAKAAVTGITERGPWTKQTITSPEEYSEVYGGLLSNSAAEIPQNIKQFFDNGGTQLVIQRICHYTDLTDPDSYTAVKGSVMLQNAGTAATAASITSTGTQNFELVPGDDLDITDDIGGLVTVTIDAAPAEEEDAVSYPIGALSGGETLTVKIDRGTVQTVTAAGGETTADDIAALINGQLSGSKTYVNGGQVRIESDRSGTGSYVEITGGTLNAILLFPTSEVQGTGDVSDITAVTGAELKTVIEADCTPNIAVTVNADDTITIATATTGSSRSLTIGGSARTKIGLATGPVSGTDDSPEDTLEVEGKTEGAYANSLSIMITAASNGDSDFFNLYVYKGGVAQESWENLIMTTTHARYVEAIINNTTTGSNLIAVTDQLLGYAAADAKPDTGTFGPMTSGDDGLSGLVDADFIGQEAGLTGLYAFDSDLDIRLVGIPGRSSATVHSALNSYVLHRDKAVYAVHPTPKLADVASATAMETFAKANLEGTTEFGCCAWPRIAIANPSTTIFGSGDTIYVESSLSKMGAFARNDHHHPDGVFTSTAGVEEGIIVGCLGVESDEILDPGKRDLIMDVNIEPVMKIEGYNWHWDGGRNLKNDGDWPRQWHARGVIYIVQSLKNSSTWIRHKKNTEKARGDWEDQGTDFLSTLPEEAFDPDRLTFFEVSDALNKPAIKAQMLVRGKLGLGFSDDAEYAEIIVTRTVAAA